jgi:predicted amidophosphoribosyltransferase
MAALVASQAGLPSTMTVVPVPLFAGKLSQRGYNQAELLAREVVRAGRAHGQAWRLDASLLRRKRSTESQAGLTSRQRRDNVRGAFFVPGSHRDPGAAASPEPAALRDRVRERMRKLNILLIDDIYTTGATARAASLALREAGAASVWVATAARAQRLETMPPVEELPMHEDVASWN